MNNSLVEAPGEQGMALQRVHSAPGGGIESEARRGRAVREACGDALITAVFTYIFFHLQSVSPLKGAKTAWAKYL